MISFKIFMSRFVENKKETPNCKKAAANRPAAAAARGKTGFAGGIGPTFWLGAASMFSSWSLDLDRERMMREMRMRVGFKI